jgi:hypothetical protein
MKKIKFVLRNITEHMWYDGEYRVYHYDIVMPCGELGSMYDPRHNGFWEVVSVNPCEACPKENCKGYDYKEILNEYYEYLREEREE